MEQWSEIRRRVLVAGVSRRQILRETGMHWRTLRKILTHSEPPGYRQKQPRPKPKLGPYWGRIEQILKEDETQPRKQRHTAKKIWERLKAEGYRGGYSVVKAAVWELRARRQEVFVPLVHRPGEAQVDFGAAAVNVNGKLRKVAFFVMALPYSDAVFVMAFERECTETFWAGHVEGFEFFGGVPRRITYDNTSVAVRQIIEGGKDRRLTRGFCQLRSHYLFDHHFCHPGRGNEKGVVEGLVKFTRLNFFVPVPQVRDLAELNARLRQQCEEDRARRLRGQTQTKEALLQEERAAFLPLPATPFAACRQVATRVNSLSLVRFDGNDYSAPVAWAHREVVVQADWREVRLYVQQEEVARHERLWSQEQVCFEPLHYLALLERKPGALDHARPLAGWTLPDCFGVLRRRLEAERDGEGTREYIRVLRLLERHALAEVRRAVEAGLSVGALTRDAIAQFLYPREDWRFTAFSLDGHPHLRAVHIAAPEVRAYAELLGGGR
jgi:transposase